MSLPALNILYASRLKKTSGRLRILSFLSTQKKPIGIERIAKALRRHVDQVTVYRTMQTLEEAGIVRQVNLRHGHIDYELANSDHHHLVCTHCGATEDFSGCGADKLAQRALKKSRTFSSIDQHAIELFGTCKKCVRIGIKNPPEVFRHGGA